MSTETKHNSLSSEDPSSTMRIMRHILQQYPQANVGQIVTLLIIARHPRGINTLDLHEELNEGYEYVHVDKNKMFRHLNLWVEKGFVAFFKHGSTRARYVIASPELQAQIGLLDKGDN